MEIGACCSTLGSHRPYPSSMRLLASLPDPRLCPRVASFYGDFVYLSPVFRYGYRYMTQQSFPEREEEVLRFWQENGIFRKSMLARQDGERFVFFEGPPTANGRPGIHHVITRCFKDLIPRFKSMQGYWVWRRAGWDTHGLPVELEVEKELGFNNKQDIEEYGIAAFNQKCRESVWKYKEEWERMTERVGYWIDLDDPYITYNSRYMENLWSILKRFWEKGLLFKDFKVVPYCVRCGTPVSSHEVAQGYETVTDQSVFVKFKVKGENNTYLLAWTTTPWTLPGNVALAVGEEIEYVRAQHGKDIVIIAKNLLPVLGEGVEVAKEVRGDELVGVEYEPLFDVPEIVGHEKAHRVYAADFVSTGEGTGIVHTAVMYGVDDFDLGSKLDLPKVHTVNEDGTFKKDVPVVGGMPIVSQKKKNADTERRIIEELEGRGLLLRTEAYEHEYPFCWRCHSPLLYYARESWFVATSQKKDELLKNNNKINWIPSHLKEGRFGEWLKDVKDWAISRERYWGTPLPIWQCTTDGCEHTEVIGSLEELNERRMDTPATFVFVRHGEAVSNVERFVSSLPEERENPLTEEGRGQVERATKLLPKHIDVTYVSPLLRTKQTAELLSQHTELGDIRIAEELREIDLGALNGESIDAYHHFFHFLRERLFTSPAGGETGEDVQKRIIDFLSTKAKEHAGQTVLLVTHRLPIAMATALLEGISTEDFRFWDAERSPGNAEVRTAVYPNWPFNDAGEVDLHRPYVDGIVLTCEECGGEMKRIEDLADVWFDSGAMPFAQGPATQEYSKERAGKKKFGEPIEGQFPADFIAEGMDQTRGWFYTLHAVSTLLEKGPAYKNVISLGLVLDEHGKKMSKSIGNTVSPWDMMEKYGADAVRWYFYTANSMGEPPLFAEDGVKERQRKFIMTTLNSLTFLETYWDSSEQPQKSADLLDEWIEIEMNALVRDVTELLEQFEIVRAARLIDGFVDNLSNWYIRRSRERLQSSQMTPEKAAAQETLRSVLETLSRLLAPFTPFLAEMMYGRLKALRSASDMLESVHLADWPKTQKSHEKEGLTDGMARARGLASLALAERARAGVKVRQKLGTLTLSGEDKDVLDGLTDIIAKEVNVGRVAFSADVEKGVVVLDTTITPELEREGIFRELTRAANALRKDTGLTPDNRITLHFEVTRPDGTADEFVDMQNELARDARADTVASGRTDMEKSKEWEDREWKLWVGIKKV